jgi:hypothetical protein
MPRVVTKYGLIEKVPVLRSKSPSGATACSGVCNSVSPRHRATPPPVSWSRLVTKTPTRVAAAALASSAPVPTRIQAGRYAPTCTTYERPCRRTGGQVGHRRADAAMFAGACVQDLDPVERCTLRLVVPATDVGGWPIVGVPPRADAVGSEQCRHRDRPVGDFTSLADASAMLTDPRAHRQGRALPAWARVQVSNRCTASGQCDRSRHAVVCD